MLNNNSLKQNDFVYIKDSKGNIKSGGYQVNSFLLKEGGAPMMTINQEGSAKGGNVAAALKNLAVPAGLFYLQQNMQNIAYPIEHKDEVIGSSLYDTLVGIAENGKKTSNARKTKKTRKNTKSKQNKTKRNK